MKINKKIFQTSLKKPKGNNSAVIFYLTDNLVFLFKIIELKDVLYSETLY